ncbi:MAG: hypothetical protein CL606_01045 [Anaerolineaceae bacterium]|nr:hypothetical protein [Anaerolineaceae bacterium]HCU80929.1 hypothetical protein [Chloroflexota bacterium]|tara:strand:+ start:102 stop:1292 length:1191 start_codon:yes stop_codon:yes gene_type:complete
MGLELNKLSEQVNNMGSTIASRSAEIADRLPKARATLAKITNNDPVLEKKIERALSMHWTGAIPTSEPVHAVFQCPSHPERANIAAADGSQVYPDRHGIALYYLINTGSIIFRHGLDEAPICSSNPHLFHEDHDLYPNEVLIPSSLVNARRDIAELRELAQIAKREVKTAPTLLMLDNGLLLYLGLQTAEHRQSDEILGEYLETLSDIESTNACIAGVIDRPRAANVLRLLRLYDMENDMFDNHALRTLGDYSQLTDRMLFGTLQPGERSAIFVNASPQNLERYLPKGQKIVFYYVNAGTSEQPVILRVEIPEWVANQPEQLSLTHSGIVEQARFGKGFPYVLMRSHELAVVSWTERGHLDEMIGSSMHRSGLSAVISRKAQGKQWTNSAKRRYGQ